jgi:hypothetical protein
MGDYEVYSLAGAESAGEPVPTDPLTASEMAEIEPERLEMLGLSLAKRRDEWVNARRASGVEKRWLEDIDQYNGRDEANKQTASMMETVAAGGYPTSGQATKPQRSTVFVNITRPKTNAAEARLTNMLIPTDDRNWGIKPTPDPKLTSQATQEARAQAKAAIAAAQSSNAPAAAPGAPGTMQQPAPTMPAMNPIAEALQGTGEQSATALAQLEEAGKRASAMQEKIDDQLIGCDYNGQLRLMIHDCSVIGTGILKGPIVVNRVRKAWRPVSDGNRTVHVLEVVEEKQPASERVDPWDVFPDPSCGENVHNGRGLFEKKNVTSKQLRELAKQPGYLAENISKVLEEGPQTAVSQTQRDIQNNRENGDPYAVSDLFEVWEYWGEFLPEDLRAAGVDVPDGAVDAISGCVILVNNHVIKGFLNPLETGDLPYDFMVWERVDGSCWGYGLPRLMQSAQRVLNAAWRQLMDNSGLSVGPQIVMNPTKVHPADKRWELTGRKIWYMNDSQAKVEEVFGSFEVPNHIKEIQMIIEMAMKFVDDESAVPTLAQGEKGTAPETVGGMQLLMNSSNVVLSRMVKQFDDMITRPHIRRYYDWNMCYAEDEDIKGDFQIDARGSSALLVRDMQSQALIQLGAFSGNGEIAPMINWEAWFKEVLKAQHIDPTDIMKSEAEIEAAKNQPPQATPEQIRAQAQLQVAQIRGQAQLMTAKARQEGEIAYAQTEAQMAHDNHMMRLQELQLQRDLAILQYVQQHKITIEQAKADLAKTAMQEETKRQVAAVEATLAQNEHHSRVAMDIATHNAQQAAPSGPANNFQR